MNLSMVKVEAHSGALCISCGEKIPKGKSALKITVFGPARGDHEFHCEKCVPMQMIKFKNIQLEWQFMHKDA